MFLQYFVIFNNVNNTTVLHSSHPMVCLIDISFTHPS